MHSSNNRNDRELQTHLHGLTSIEKVGHATNNQKSANGSSCWFRLGWRNWKPLKTLFESLFDVFQSWRTPKMYVINSSVFITFELLSKALSTCIILLMLKGLSCWRKAASKLLAFKYGNLSTYEYIWYLTVFEKKFFKMKF